MGLGFFGEVGGYVRKEKCDKKVAAERRGGTQIHPNKIWGVPIGKPEVPYVREIGDLPGPGAWEGFGAHWQKKVFLGGLWGGLKPRGST